MNKYVKCLLVFVMVVCIVCGCKKQTVLDYPTYPLNDDAIYKALEQADLSWTIAKVQDPSKEKVMFYLQDQNELLVAFVFSGVHDERRYLDISLMLYYENTKITRPIYEDEWEQVIVFATLLYGGFYSDHQVYDLFTSDIGKENVDNVTSKKTQSNTNQAFDAVQRTVWEKMINGIYCTVKIDTTLSKTPKAFLNTIRFDTVNLFGSEAKQ